MLNLSSSMNVPDIGIICKWGKVKEVHTVRGPRMLRTAAATEDFWPVWNEHAATLKLLGLQVKRRMDDPNKWQVLWWKELPADVLAQRAKLVEMSEATCAAVDIPKPDGLDYYPFQKAGIRYCLNAFAANGVLIGDEMGLGKTVQAIGVINATPGISRVLIICPLTLKANWERELSRWLVRPMTIGHARADFWPRDTDIVLCHYNILHRFTTRLANFWDLIVMDECHRLKNGKARQTRCVVGYKPTRKEAAAGAVPTSGIPARRKLALSGTPFENRPAELWPVVSYIAPHLFSSRSAYERRYCGGGVDGGYYAANGATNLEELGQRLRGCCMVRRLKRDVLKELPPKTRQVVQIDTDGLEDAIKSEQRVWHLHEADLAAAQVAMELAKASDTEAEFKAAVEALRAGMSAAFRKLSAVRHATALAMVPAMVEALQSDMQEVGKAVVFAYHQDVLEACAREFQGQCVLIHGDHPKNPLDRQPIVDRFQTDPKIRILFGSIDTCGEGLTMTAAWLCWFFEQDWRPSRMNQCSDRLHRIGQKDNVLCKYAIAPGTISAHMIQTWIQKEEIIERCLDSERAELAAEATIMPKAEPIATRSELDVAATAITAEQRWAILMALRELANVCDGAQAVDGCGFSKLDVAVGKSLAAQNTLSPRQAALGQKLVAKYRRQIGTDTLTKCGIK